MTFMGLPELIILLGVIIMFPFWKICYKARFSRWLSILMIIPLVNLVILYYIAFAEWPSQKHAATPLKR